MALFDVTGPIPTSGPNPSARTRGPPQSEGAPGVRVCGVLQDAPEDPDGVQGGGEASSIVPELELVRLAGRAVPEPAPTLAGRMGDHGPGARVEPRVPGRVPGVDALQAEVGPAGLHEKGGYDF